MHRLLYPLLGLLLLFTSCTPDSSNKNAASSDLQSSENLQQEPTSFYGFSLDSLDVVEAVVKVNENLSEILSRYNISGSQIHAVASLPQDLFDARKLQVDKPYTILHQRDSAHTAKGFIYHPNKIDYVAVHLGDSIEVEKGHNSVDTVVHALTGTIESSLYLAIQEAGGSPALVMELADVYAWVIDFFGLQKGDHFKVVYSTYEVNGEEAGFGKIHAAIFNHYGNDLYAFSYDQGEGLEYFDQEGNSLRKTFLKAPLHYRRISSRFSYSRLHPILKIRRPHLGVDYAAPRGTPVVSVGDGVVIKKYYAGGAGKMVRIRHNSNYETAYLHLSSYGPGIEVGTQVKQGQLIGKVGSTGLSTGPHLDFRFYKNGKPVDPLKVEPQSSEPISEAHKDIYFKHMRMMKRRLDQINGTHIQLAMLKN
ncbi:MAG: peptidoglycan DD-metalloendopeptidase family protein [Bacteroidota bacterium]